MARRKNWSAEESVAKLRQIAVQMAQGKSLALACKEAEISQQSYDRWRKEYGGVAVEQATWARIGCSASAAGKG